MRRLAIFDVDGTLTSTTAVDDECYMAAAAEVFGLAPDQLDWSEAPHVTDLGIAHYLSERHRGCRASAAELAALRSRFLTRLGDAHRADPARFAAMPGARALLAALPQAGWHIALATGGYGHSARLKLEIAGLTAALACPFASADDGASRADIVRAARSRAAGAPSDWARVVSVGDGLWDVRTARELGLPFVGVGAALHAAALREAGASHVLPDLVDVPAVLAALEAARVPGALGPSGRDARRG